MKRVIVTGHRGFIGSNMCNLLAEYGYAYYGIDALYKGANKFNTNGVKHIIKEYNNCLSDNILYNLLEKDFDTFDDVTVVHFAAYSHVDDSIKNPINLVNINIKSTHMIAEFCARKNIPFILVSTDEVLGSLTLNQKSFNIHDKLQPRNPYSYSKAACELLVESLSHQYPDWRYFITRCVNNFGPYQDPTKFIPVCISKIMKREKIPVYGKGEQIRSWIPVIVHDRIILKLIEILDYTAPHDYETKNCIIHIGSDIELTNIEMVKKICQLMNENADEYIQFIKDPRGNAHDFRYSLDCSETKNLFGSNCLDFNLDEQLNNTILFYHTKINNFDKWI